MIDHQLIVRPNFRLAKHDPAQTYGFADRDAASAKLENDIERLVSLQDRFAAERRWGIVVILQGVDAAGKDGTIKHVMRGLNPQGVTVQSFRQPSSEELAHDYLWRVERALPERGRIGVFNRSHYEEVLVTRLHPELLEAERLPDTTFDDRFWKRRFKQIRRFEHYLVDNGFLVLKFFLHISREEQARRLLERIRDPNKHWKFSATDLETTKRWDEYAEAYEQMLRATSTNWSPWYAIAADRKWAAHLAIADVLVETLERLGPQYPKSTPEQLAQLEAAARELGAYIEATTAKT